MLAILLAGDDSVTGEIVTRAQLPLLLNQLVVTTTFSADIATETDTALDATPFIGSALIPADVAVETDTAMNLTVDNPPGTIFLSVDVAAETDTTFTATVASTQAGSFPGITYPGSTTYPWSGEYYPVDIATETDSAFDATAVLKRLLPASSRSGVSLTPATVVEETDLDPVTPT